MSADLISAVTDAVLKEVAEWQNRPLDVCYALVFFDAIRVKIRDEGFVRNRPSTLRLAFARMAPRRYSASGSSRPRAPSSGCAS